MRLKRPRRGYYANEQAWLIACSRYLDVKFPEREQFRPRLTYEAIVARMQALLALDRRLTQPEEAHWDALAAAYRAHRRERALRRTTPTPRSTDQEMKP